MHPAAQLSIALLWGICGACGGEGDDATTATPPRAPLPGITEEAEDHLATLGYIDVTEEVADPSRSGVTLYDRGRTQPGYNLFCMRGLPRAELFTLDGRVVHSWEDPEAWSWIRCQLLEGGDLLVVGRSASTAGSRAPADSNRHIARYSFEGRRLWKRSITAHHHTAIAPDGGLLTLTFDYRLIPELDPVVPVREDFVLMLDADGQTVESRSLYDALESNPELFEFHQFPVMKRSGNLQLDLIHANTVDWIDVPALADRHPIYQPGHVIVTSRHQDLIAIIAWKTNQLVWAWGPDEIERPHDAFVLDNGNVLVFDNGTRKRAWSRVIELDPIRREIVWEYRGSDPKSFFSRTRGANQRLANGNTLITDTHQGRAFEIRPDGEVVWEFFNPHLDSEGHRRTMRRVERLPPEWVDAILSKRGAARGE